MSTASISDIPMPTLAPTAIPAFAAVDKGCVVFVDGFVEVDVGTG